MLAFLAVPKLNRIRQFKGAIVGGSVKRTCVKARGGVAYMCDQVELLWELEGFQQAVESVVETFFCIHKWQKVRRATTESAIAGRSSIIEFGISFEIAVWHLYGRNA